MKIGTHKNERILCVIYYSFFLRMHGRTHSITKVIRDALGQISGTHLDQRAGTSSHALGFGQVYNGGSNCNGFLSAIPMVSQNSLRHDLNGETYNNGALFVMESMKWDYCNVTVKRMHRDSDAHEGGAVDHLINELEFMGKLRHPNILIFMGVCQTTDLETLVLIFERIGEGSLYNHLHEKMEQMSLPAIQDLAVQISGAILFIHHQNCIHCNITSHSINIITSSSFKLGNFEHMIERSKCEMGKKSTVASTPQARLSWTAPEIIHSLPPTPLSDMYSFCCVLWEIFIGEIPWEPYDDEGIRNKLLKGDTLPINCGKIPEMFQIILGFGLKLDPNSRKLSFLHVQDLLMAAPEDSKKYIKDHYKNIMMLGTKHDQSSFEADRRAMYTNSTSDTDQIPHINKKHHLDTNLCTTEPALVPKKSTGSDLNKNNTKYPPSVCKDWTDPKAMDGTPDEQADSHRQPGSSVVYESQCKDGLTQGKIYMNVSVSLNIGFHQKWRRHPDQYEYTVEAHPQTLPTKQTRNQLSSDYDSTRKTSASETIGHLYKDCHATGQASSTHETSGHSFSKSNAQISVTPEIRGYSCKGYYISGQNSAVPETSGYSYVDSYSTDQQAKYQRPKKDNEKEYVTVNKTSRNDLDQDSNAALHTLDGEHRMSASKRTVSKDTGMDQEKGIGYRQNISTDAISKFSYLNLQQKCQTSAKPAGHNTEYLVDEDHTTAGKLTTKGSLYAIYNEYSPEKTYPQSKDTYQAPRSASLSRRSNIKESSPPLLEIEGGWFGGRGSVRNLVDLFQQQNKEHYYKQTVLEGKLSRSAMHREEEPLLYSRDQETSQDPNKSNNCSNIMEKNKEGSLGPEHAEMAKREQSDENESSYSFTTVSTSESAEGISERYMKDTNSQDSVTVSEWVDKELEKIKKSILKESSEDCGFTEDVIIALAKRQKSSDSTNQRGVEKKKAKNKFKVKGYKEKVEQNGSNEVEEFYFDDEIYANMGKETHMQLSESFEMLSSKENQARSRKAPNDKLHKEQ
ncbi:hypothetical protein CHS0354_041806 [Potamilus streckersoni]|uniref:Protein kinase domain-containing protein n=1 Tax=Potamilus streckersoni TaxID=2493646 RepID=A0AAE0W5J4_9BIVA|nr:hypothetical protein CHS0354_041806 [Potamilus streckersoni]